MVSHAHCGGDGGGGDGGTIALTPESIARWTSTRPIDFGEEAVPWNARTARATGAAATVASTVLIFVSSFLPGTRQKAALRAMAAARTQEIATYLARGSVQGGVNAEFWAACTLFAWSRSVRREVQETWSSR